ncbi:hypothetical protein B0H11DRAFT_2352285 [Mycena galericulata]|nr:hypothetical protein B0H11DRAFT_2352285 [Mycena galericulata]
MPNTSPVLPPYSTTLHLGERLLEQGRNVNTVKYVNRNTGDYVRRVGRSTLTLQGQENGSEIPAYRRGARIAGAIHLADATTVSGIVLQVRGRIDVTVTDLGFFEKFRNDTHVTFDLPPTYDITLPGFFAKSLYTISIVVTRSDPRFQFLSSDQMISVPFIYTPGWRIPRLPRNPTTFPTDNQDWKKSSTRLTALAPVAGEAPELHLAFPNAGPFDLKVPIPYCIQLTGPVQQYFRNRDPDSSTQGVRCWFQRDTIINFHGRPTKRTINIGRSIPHRGGAALVWAGELRCDTNVLDAVVVEITPSEYRASQLVPLRHTQPIKLASPAWHS